MTMRTDPWSEGTPSWVDLMVSDVPAAQEFYGQLFGWEGQQGPPEARGYVVARLRGLAVAGIGSSPPDNPMPPVWTTYLAVDDLEAMVAKVESSGGTVVMAPMDVMEEGRFAVTADPTGAVFGMWQAGKHGGVEVVEEHGALTWNECLTRDHQTATSFYVSVFGYRLQEIGNAGQPYSLLQLGEKAVAGVGQLDADVPAQVPPYWLTYFAVDDPDAIVAWALELGAKTQVEPHDSPYGRWAALVGLQGEVFAVIKPSAPPEMPVD